LPNCKVCNKETSERDEYCELHAKAYGNITKKYDDWKKALNVAWNDYLIEILKNPSTGTSAKEVAQQLISKE
jgi:hypothetical protein